MLLLGTEDNMKEENQMQISNHDKQIGQCNAYV